MRTRRLATGAFAFGLAAAALPLLAAPPVRYVPVLDVGAQVPDLPLVDQAGRPFSLRRLGGRAAVVSFMYTHCSDPRLCPLVSSTFERLQWTTDPRQVRLVEITLAPEVDTPPVLSRYAAAFGAQADRWTFATGSPEAIDELSRRLGIDASAGPHGTVVHSEALVVLDPDGRIAARVDGSGWSAAQATSLADEALHRSEHPLVRFGLWLASGVAGICGGGTSGLTVAAAIALFTGLLGVFGAAMFRAAAGVHR